MRRRAFDCSRVNVWLAVLAAALAVVVGACTRAHDCRPGTLFVNLQFAPYTGVEHVFVVVMVTVAGSLFK